MLCRELGIEGSDVCAQSPEVEGTIVEIPKMAAPQDRQNERTVGSGTLIPQINLYDKANKVAYFGDSDLAASSHIDSEKYSRGNPLLGESEKPARALLAALTTLLSLTVVAFLVRQCYTGLQILKPKASSRLLAEAPEASGKSGACQAEVCI